MILCFHWRFCSWRDLKMLVHSSELNYRYTPKKWLSAFIIYYHYYAILSLFQNIKRQEERQCEITIPHFLAWNNSKAVVINTLREVVTCKRAWTSTSANSCATKVTAGGFQLPFYRALAAAIPLILHSVFPPYCAAHEPFSSDVDTYYADLSQTAPRLLRPFLGRWNTKEGIQLGTPPMSLACCTPRNVAEQPMPGS